MLHHDAVRTIARALIVAALLAAVGGTSGCGQRGPLYHPDQDNPERRR